MRVGIYNQMFGLNGRGFWSNVLGHWAVHYQPNPEKVWKRANLSKTVEIIDKARLDVVGVCEVLEGQEEELEECLRKIGFNYFYEGRGHETKRSCLGVMGLVGSKFEGRQRNVRDWPVRDELGGGGGFVQVGFGEFDLTLAHLGLPSKNYYWDQIYFLQESLGRLKGRQIVLGDMNLSYRDFRDYFHGFDLASGELKTCSSTRIMKWFYDRDVDHILVRGFEQKGGGVLEGRSDHKLVWADLG